MAGPNTPLSPHYTHKSTSVRRAYIQNLTDLLHVCLLRRDTVRARRAWSILIRCREIDWRSRWYWGLECLNASAAADNQLAPTSQPEYEGREVERWLKSVRVSAKEVDKPSLLHALVLHLIKHERFRQALDELETYLTSYPYLLSGPLHTYAGLLSFYLAQPASNLASSVPAPATSKTRNHTAETVSAEIDSAHSVSSRSDNSTVRQPTKIMEPPNPILSRQARAYFVKALTIDGTDVVAGEFIEHIDHPEQVRARSLSTVDRSRDDDDGSEGKSDDDVSVDGKEDDETKGDESDDSGTDLEALMGEIPDEDDDIE